MVHRFDRASFLPCFLAGMMKQTHQEAQPEFQIQPDEFPALPGANKQSGNSQIHGRV